MTIPKHRQVSMQIHTCTISHQIMAKNFVVQSLALPFFFFIRDYFCSNSIITTFIIIIIIIIIIIYKNNRHHILTNT